MARQLRAEGLKVASQPSFYALYVAFRAKTYIISSTRRQISVPLSRHANVINLWHGISVKKIGMMNVRSAKQLEMKRKEFSAIKLIPSTSPLTQQCFMQAFDKTQAETPIMGEPRNDFLIQNKGCLLYTSPSPRD